MVRSKNSRFRNSARHIGGRLLVVLAVLIPPVLCSEPVLSAEPAFQGRVEVTLAAQHRPKTDAIKKEFAEAGFSNVHIQFVKMPQAPPNIGLGREVPAELARAAIRLALKYNNAVTILLPTYLFPPKFITIASSNFDDTVEFPIDEGSLKQLQDPSLSTEAFHALYRELTRPPEKKAEAGNSIKEAKTRGTAMLKDAEDMVAHGGMGDAKAIVHHCGEVTKHAEAILKMLPPADQHSKEASTSLQEAIKYCQKVATFGDRVDPGVTLNPATKARAAVRDAVKHLSLIKEESVH